MNISYCGITWLYEYSEILISTNDAIKKHPQFSHRPLIISCAYQSGGKGQGASSWESAPGENILISLSYKPEQMKAAKQFSFSIAIALSIVDFLIECMPDAQKRIRIKWPNDIYIDDNKICGILIEHQIRGEDVHQSIAGIGVNINQMVFLSDAPNPTSLRKYSGQKWAIEDLRHRLLQKISKRLTELDHGFPEFQKEIYLKKLYRSKGFWPFLYMGESIYAKITGIDEYGQLQFITSDNKKNTAAMKEIAFILPK